MPRRWDILLTKAQTKNFEEQTILRVPYEQTWANQPTDIDVKKITLVSYDNANVRRNVKEIQLKTYKLRIY